MSQVIDSMICCEDGWKSYKHLPQIAMFDGDLPWLDKKNRLRQINGMRKDPKVSITSDV